MKWLSRSSSDILLIELAHNKLRMNYNIFLSVMKLIHNLEMHKEY